MVDQKKVKRVFSKGKIYTFSNAGKEENAKALSNETIATVVTRASSCCPR